MLQYALLHLFGYDVTIDDLRNFRVSALVGVTTDAPC
jgi:transketolase